MADGSSGGWAPPVAIGLSEADIQAAMTAVPAYIDITAADFREIYHLAFQHALRRLSDSVRVGNVLQRAVVTVRRDTPLTEVAARMSRNRVSGVPVVTGDGRLEGIISEHDFVTHAREEDGRTVIEILPAEASAAAGPEGPAYAHVAADIMTAQVTTLGEDTPLPEIANRFTQWQVNRLPVTDAQGRLVGIVARWDLVQSVLSAFATGDTD